MEIITSIVAELASEIDIRGVKETENVDSILSAVYRHERVRRIRAVLCSQSVIETIQRCNGLKFLEIEYTSNKNNLLNLEDQIVKLINEGMPALLELSLLKFPLYSLSSLTKQVPTFEYSP